MRPSLPPAHPSTPAPRTTPRADRRRRARAWRLVPAAVLASCLTATGAAWAGPAEPGTRVLAVSGTVREAVVDHPEDTAGGPHGADGDEGAHELVLDTMVEVGGALYDVPESVVEALPATDALVSGDPVVVAVRAERGSSAAEALAAAADGTHPAARVLSVTPAPGVVAAQADAPTAAGAVEHAAAAPGPRTLTVLPVHWGHSEPDVSTLRTVAAAASRFWAEQSGGALTFAPTVHEPRRISDLATCDTAAIMRLALAAHGVAAPRGTRHVAVHFPERADCGGWAGMGSISGTSIWVNGVDTVDVLAHELGHNLGVGHANTATCVEGGARVSLSAQCTVKPYADVADVMGFATRKATGRLNTALADQLGFATVHEVTDLPVTLDVARLADVGAPRAVRIPTPHGTVYVDFRPAQGPDVRMPAWAGVQVHRLAGDRYPESHLLDMQPGSRTAFATPALPTGGAWDVPGTGQTLTVTAVSDTHATLALAPTGGTGGTGGTEGTGASPTAGASDLTFVPVTPTRLLDTRGTAAPLGARGTRDLVVAGRSGVPADARAVALNLTAVGATARTHLRAWPAGEAMPGSSVLNTDPSRVVATGVMLAVGAARSVRVYNDAGQVHLVADVTGYYVDGPAAGGVGFEALPSPARVLDTRTAGGRAAPPVTSGGRRTVTLAGRHGVPADATAVVVNVTSVDPTSAGYLVAYPAGSPRPLASTVNHLPGDVATNRAAVRLGAGALTVDLEGGAGHVLVDLVGWYGPGGRGLFTPVTPVRAFDTRRGGGALGGGAARTFDVRGPARVPPDARTVVMTLTTTNLTAPTSYTTVWDGTTPRPATSDLNASPRYDKSNLLVVPWSPTGAVRVYNDQGSVDVIGDVFGYFS